MNKIIRDEKEKLTPENEKRFLNMIGYLSEKGLNFYAFEDIQMELIGIFQEYQKREESLDQVFDQGDEAFCDQLANDAVRCSMLETCLKVLIVIMLFLGFSILGGILQSMFDMDVNAGNGILLFDLQEAVFSFSFALFAYGISKILQRRTYQKNALVIGLCYILGALLLIFLPDLLLRDILHERILSVSVWALILYAAGTAGLIYVYRRYAKKRWLHKKMKL